MTETMGISYKLEESLLWHFQQIHPDPWACLNCHCPIDSSTGWKPRVAFIVNEYNTGVNRAVFDIFCGNCSKIVEWEKIGFEE